MKNLFAYMKGVSKEKREYRQMMARVDALPEDYSFVFKKIQHYMWSFASGSGMDIMLIFTDLIDLFEEGAAESKRVLEITGEDVAAFSDELLRNAATFPRKWQEALNRDIMKKIGK